MSKDQLKITYKIYLEAEDINQSRIVSCISFVKNLFENCTNSYLKGANFEDESDLDDFTLRFYADREINEENCSNPEDAEAFVLDIAEFLDKIAEANSYMDLDGEFEIEYKGKKDSFNFSSESGHDFCDFSEK